MTFQTSQRIKYRMNLSLIDLADSDNRHTESPGRRDNRISTSYFGFFTVSKATQDLSISLILSACPSTKSWKNVYSVLQWLRSLCIIYPRTFLKAYFISRSEHENPDALLLLELLGHEEHDGGAGGGPARGPDQPAQVLLLPVVPVRPAVQLAPVCRGQPGGHVWSSPAPAPAALIRKFI